MHAFALLLRLFKYMCICGERFDLIVLYTETDLYRNAQKSAVEAQTEREGCGSFLGRDGGVHILPEGAFSPQERGVLTKLCDVQISLSDAVSALALRNERFFEVSPEAERILLCGAQRKPTAASKKTFAAGGKFTENGFAVDKPHGALCYKELLRCARTRRHRCACRS